MRVNGFFYDFFNYFIDFFHLEGDKSIVITNWISSGSLNVDWSLNLNLLTVTMIIMVNFVSTIIHVYSVGYMSKDPRRIIFMGYLGLFTFLCFFLFLHQI